jgi:hypothetical protein
MIEMCTKIACNPFQTGSGTGFKTGLFRLRVFLLHLGAVVQIL